MRLEELGQLKIPMTSSGIEPVTFRLQPTTLQRAPLMEWKYIKLKTKNWDDLCSDVCEDVLLGYDDV
jgi:hypothetical protein